MSIASEEDIREFVEEASEILGERLEDVILFGSYARRDFVPGSDVDLLFLVSDKRRDDWRKISQIAADHSLDKDVKFSPKVLEKTEFKERENESAGFYREVADQGVKL